MGQSRLERAIALIDDANRDDPNTLVVRGVARPKALGEGELATEWVHTLVAEPSEALLLAVRAHHLRRWTVPRSTYPDGRAGYLRWRRDLHEVHAADVAKILEEVGYDGATIERVQAIIRKKGLAAGDSEVQAFEDALCLVFIEAEFDELAARLDEETMASVVKKTLKKMTPRGRELAATLR